MPCYHPLRGFPVAITDKGKPKYRIVDYDTHHAECDSCGNWTFRKDSKLSPFSCQVLYQEDSVVVPCGQCIGCRLEYSRQWANRCMLELQYHDSAYFITLTYDDLHVPTRFYGHPETGEALPSLTLRRRDLQLFFKRLRKAHPDDRIRFYAAGEYGSNTMRPHYHAIVFGLHLSDLQPVSRSKLGYQYYSSAELQRAWSISPTNGGNQYSSGEVIPLGFVMCGQVTWETCAYTARYVTKKLTGNASEYYNIFNIDPPFTAVSNKPGLARQYYEDHPDLFEHEYINISTPTGGRKFRPPKYFDKLFDIDQPELSAELKETRRLMAVESTRLKMDMSSMNYLDLLAVQEQAKLDSSKKLIREL